MSGRRSRGLYRGDQTFPRYLVSCMKAEDSYPLTKETAQHLLDMVYDRFPLYLCVDGNLGPGSFAKLRPWLDWRTSSRRRQSIQGQYDRCGGMPGFSGRIILYPRGHNRGTLLHEAAHSLLPWNADRKATGTFDRWGTPKFRNLHHGPNFARALVAILKEFASEDPGTEPAKE